MALQEKAQVHYMGSIVLQNMGDKKYHVIDDRRQERLAAYAASIWRIAQYH